jgi:hypothetical protein
LQNFLVQELRFETPKMMFPTPTSLHKVYQVRSIVPHTRLPNIVMFLAQLVLLQHPHGLHITIRIAVVHHFHQAKEA